MAAARTFRTPKHNPTDIHRIHIMKTPSNCRLSILSAPAHIRFALSSARWTAALAAIGLAVLRPDAHAASAIWSGTAATADWNTTANWSAAFPNGTGDTATFSNALSGTIGSAANPITLSAAIN